MAETYQFIVRKTSFEYEVTVKGLSVKVEPTTQNSSEIHLTLATTLRLLSEGHLKNSLDNNPPHLTLIEYFQRADWVVHSIV